jgi:hypothetical protein
MLPASSTSDTSPPRTGGQHQVAVITGVASEVSSGPYVSNAISKDIKLTAPASVLPPPQPPPARTSRMTIAPLPRMIQHPRPVSPLVEYQIPLDKARALPSERSDYFIPPGSSADPSILIRPASPTTPFEFPFNMAEETLGLLDFLTRPARTIVIKISILHGNQYMILSRLMPVLIALVPYCKIFTECSLPYLHCCQVMYKFFVT